jgi:phenylacetic acid degradation operon negative regulatory protein
MSPSPRSLILDLLSTLGRGAAPVRALVVAGRLFGIAENAMRVALTRLLADELVERDARGRYRLGPAAAAVSQETRGWRHIEEQRVLWDGGWVGVSTTGLPRGRAAQQRRRARALRLLGFRGLVPSLEIRPDNLAGGVAGVREHLAALGLEPPALVFRIDALDDESAARARGLWDGAALVASYREARAEIEASEARLPGLAPADAMTESFLLGGAAIRKLVLDPLLPEPIVPARERRALVAAMRRYDRLGRRAWAGWLGGDEPEPQQWPAAVRASGTDAELDSALERS